MGHAYMVWKSHTAMGHAHMEESYHANNRVEAEANGSVELAFSQEDVRPIPGLVVGQSLTANSTTRTAQQSCL